MKTEMNMMTFNPEDERWRVHAKCAGQDVDKFFLEKGSNVRYAKELCDGCPVARECVDYAVKYNIEFGVWGGTSPQYRQDIRMGRKVNPHAAVRR